MSADLGAEARRFTWLIDVLYDSNVRLVASATVLLEDIFSEDMPLGEESRTASRLAEMQTLRYLQLPHHSQKVTL